MNTKAVYSLFVVLIMAYAKDLWNENVQAAGRSMADDILDEMFDDTVPLSNGSTPDVAWGTTIVSSETAVTCVDEFDALKFARHIVMNASIAQFDTFIIDSELLTVSTLTPKTADEDLATVSFAEKLLRCVENTYTVLSSPSVTYRNVITAIRNELALAAVAE